MFRKNLRLFLNRISNLPDILWILIGFLIPFSLFFVRRVFFKETTMQFLRYVPASGEFIGGDLKNTLNIARAFFTNHQTPYIGDYAYTPFTNIFVAPLLVFNFSIAYKIVTIINLLCYLAIAFILPIIFNKEKYPTSQIIFVFITGLYSYGLQFELERGQFNLLAVTLCLVAIVIFHYRPKYSIIAYILFIISVQLKVYPFIFILMFIRDFHNWKENLKRIFLLGIVNLIALFILGYEVFLDFIKAILNHMKYPPISGVNHSIKSFVTIFSSQLADLGLDWLYENKSYIEYFLLFFVVSCIFLIIIKSQKNNLTGLNKYLLLACTIGALLIPSASQDYTLSYLAAPFALLINDGFKWIKSYRVYFQILFIILLVALSSSYFSTIFPLVYKPQIFILRNNFLPLFFMLLIVTLINFFYRPSIESS